MKTNGAASNNSLVIYDSKNQTEQLINEKTISEKNDQLIPISLSHQKEEETLSDVSDSEISQFFLSPEETAMKSIIWHNMHKNWVKEQAEKKDLSMEKKNVKKRKKKEDESFFKIFGLES